MSEAILADQPEIIALAGLASLAPSKMAAAFKDPDNLFEHLTLEEITRLGAACARFAVIQHELVKALDVWSERARTVLAASSPEE